MSKSFTKTKTFFDFDDTISLIGEHVGLPIKDMVAQHPDYLRWCIEKNVMQFSNEVKETLKLIAPKPKFDFERGLRKTFPENFRPKGFYDMDYDDFGFDDIPF
jgi:hypothetical protein